MTARMRSIRLIACAMAVLASCGPGWAEQIARVVHGRQIAASIVGPSAAGIKSLMSHPGGTIRDGQTLPFARQVAQAARYDGHAVNGPHLLIEGVHFTGSLDIQSSQPVVLRGVSVRPEAKSHWGLLTRPGSAPVLILWCEVRTGDAAAGDAIPIGTGLDLRAAGGSVYRTHVSRVVDGIHVSGSDTAVVETLVDALAFFNGAHNDGVQLLGPVENVSIRRSRIMNPHPQTSAVSLTGRRLVVEDNYLAGGGYTIYGGSKGDATGAPAASQMQIARNVFGRDYFARAGHFGAVAYWDRSGANRSVWSANRFSTGEDVLP